MKIRIIHNQTTKGPLLITDIDQGSSVDNLDESRKQPCYLPYNHKYWDGTKVVTDTTLPGYLDLTPSDKVRLSLAQGNIKGFMDAGLIEVIELPVGANNEPVVFFAFQEDE
jgi:hypothetical protein